MCICDNLSALKPNNKCMFQALTLKWLWEWFPPLLALTSAACFFCQQGSLQQMKRWVRVTVFCRMKQNGINEGPWCARHYGSMHKLPPSLAMKLEDSLTIFHVSELIMPVWKQLCIKMLWKEESSCFSEEFQDSQWLWGQNEKMGDGIVVCLKP